MRKMIVVLVATSLLAMGSASELPRSLILQEEPLDSVNRENDSFRGRAVLSVEKSTVAAKERISLDIRFVNTGNSHYFYNPFFMELIRKPAQLVLYDSKQQYQLDFFGWINGSRRLAHADDWTYIPGGSYVGTKLRTVGLEKPGVYYLQVVYHKAFISPRPHRLRGNPPKEEKTRIKEFYDNYSRDELFRSNPVKIVVVEKENGS